MIYTLSRILKILDQFEAKSIEAIRIDNEIKCDNYENVAKLKLIQHIRKAVITAYQSPPKNHHYPLEKLIINPKINF